MILLIKRNFKLVKRRYFRKGRFLNMRIVLIAVYIIGASSIAFCDDGGLSGKELTTALTIAGTATIGIAILGIRYFIMGKPAGSLLGDSVSGLIDQAKNAGNELIINAENASNRLIDNAGSTVNQEVRVVTAAVDDRMATVTNAINPVTHVQAMGDKAASLVKKILNKANDALASNTGFAGVEEEVKTRLYTGLQKALVDLDKTGDVNAALQKMPQEDLTMLAEYTVISREPSTTGSAVEMASVMEPLCLQYSCLVFVVLVLTLKLAPFSLYLWIRTKQIFGF